VTRRAYNYGRSVEDRWLLGITVCMMPSMTTLLRFAVFLWLFACSASAAISITPRNTVQQWKVAEFTISGTPIVSNPYDPDLITVKGTFTGPSGKATSVEGFWFQNYTSTLSGGNEILTASGGKEWRIRFTPDEMGAYQIAVTATTASGSITGNATFDAAAGAPTSPFKAVPKIAANQRFFEVAGDPLVLNGANVCWHGGRGTYDYLDWFPKMLQNGENYARLWMCPWAFGIQTEANSLTNYSLTKAWQLDRVMRIAETNGIFIMLCLEYHGMFQTVADQFGGNNAWVQNPYNSANGGPCATPDEFFTSTTARDIYKKRLRYIMARWGASPNLLCWEFFNEIDNSYNNLNATDVANWHSALGTWLKTNDPYKRLVTTSLTGSSDRAEIWNIASLEFAQYHSYGLAQPASKLPAIVQGMMGKYHKPVILSEYGIDSGGFHADKDPYYRGLRQGIWAGLMSNTPGTAMSWWWEEIHARNLYGIYNSISQFLKKSALGNGSWTPIAFMTNGDPPTTVGTEIDGAAPFNATLNLSGQWGFLSTGALAVADPDAAARAPAVLSAFFHGTAHSELKNPCKLSAWFGSNAKLVMHLNSVSDGAIMNVLVDGVSVFTQSVPNKDNLYDVNNEYNIDYSVNITPGKHIVQVRNTGADWFYLDWIRLENVQPSTYANNWTPSPVSIGEKSGAESLIYVVNPTINFPGNATNQIIAPMTNGIVKLSSWPAGSWTAIWNDAKTFAPLGKTTGNTTNGVLQLSIPGFSEDVAARIIPANHASVAAPSSDGTITLQLSYPAAAHSALESTSNFFSWQIETNVPFSAQIVSVPFDLSQADQYFRITTPQ